MGRLTTRELNRALLARQYLLQPADLTALELIERLVGLQAQNFTAPYFGIWTRLKSVTTEQISQLIESRQAVRIAMMRSTVHLVSAADCLALRGLLDPASGKALTPGSGYGRALAGVDRAELSAVARAAVSEGPMLMTDLAALLLERFPGVPRDALLFAARADLPLVQTPPRGLWGRSGQLTVTTADRWLGRSPDPIDPDPIDPDPTEPVGAGSVGAADGRPAAAARLIRRYLAAFGPAGVQDVQTWSGLTRLGEVVDAMRPELAVFTGPNGSELFDLPDAARPDPDTPAPARLVPEFDNLLLSHADRSRVIDPSHRPKVFSVNGIISGTVLLDGFVRAVWKYRRVGKKAEIEVEPLARIGVRDRARVEREALRALDFAGSAGAVRWAA